MGSEMCIRDSDNTGKGAVVINGIIPTGARVKRIVPKIATDLTATTRQNVIDKINSRNSFALRYNAQSQQWIIIDSSNLPANTLALNDPANWNRKFEGDGSSTGLDNSWVLRFNYSATEWEMLARKTQFVIGSPQKLKFTNLNFNSSFSSETQKPLRDNIKILKINPKSKTNPDPMGREYKFNAFGTFTYADGYTDPHNIRVSLADPDNDGYPNDPEAFNKILANQTINLGKTSVDGYDYTIIDNTNGTTQVNGACDLHVQYNRIADINQVIDPSTTNIIDTYVLLNSYNTQFRTWAQYDGRIETKPNSPTVSELGELFSNLNEKKSISDQVIYRPVKYKILFGDLASGELQARFNVTKTVNSTLSDTEIKQRVINLINSYFSIDNWDFGEEFYFTEMAAFIHNNMIGEISQITISPVSTSEDSTALFEITSDSDELFLPILTSSNIVVTKTIAGNSTTISQNTGVSIQ